ncbi:MAG TPA: aminotransferase class IV [Stackebrandtia sp.]|uniref:aminotransferase class IV n=1 Tax=Stackebrandtia sp. TaxID=2023065 RepID=UPI002D2D3727|nr:aminotransferase class IV [Stackebrandtia sp.]HZE41942.1 aminotransferase class IV [Stackebrandtia sp.]
MAEVVAILGQGVVDAAAPILHADDLGAVRGDGCFETINVRAGQPWQLEPHLARMVRSADKLDVDFPDLADIRELCAAALAAFGAEREGALRLICTRGLESGSAPTFYATLNPVADAVIAKRRDGLRLTALSLGYPVDERGKSPWLLGGAKTLSYAVTMSAQRYATSNGYDDALWTSSDGYAFEGPTSTLLWLEGDTLYTVPADTGILAGTTSAYLLDNAPQLGLRPAEARVRVDDLPSKDGVWMASSVRGIAPVIKLDEATLKESARTADLQRLAGFEVPA